MSNEKKDKKNKSKNIEVVTGNGDDLKISPVYDHIKSDKMPGSEKKKNIVIPKGNSNSKSQK